MKKIPNIIPSTGISTDFRRAFGNLTNYMERIRENDPPRTRHLAKRSFLHRSIPRYEEFFDPSLYEDVITEFNRDTVEKLNLVIDSVNQARKENLKEDPRLPDLEKELIKLITGRQME